MLALVVAAVAAAAAAAVVAVRGARAIRHRAVGSGRLRSGTRVRCPNPSRRIGTTTTGRQLLWRSSSPSISYAPVLTRTASVWATRTSLPRAVRFSLPRGATLCTYRAYQPQACRGTSGRHQACGAAGGGSTHPEDGRACGRPAQRRRADAQGTGALPGAQWYGELPGARTVYARY